MSGEEVGGDIGLNDTIVFDVGGNIGPSDTIVFDVGGNTEPNDTIVYDVDGNTEPNDTIVFDVGGTRFKTFKKTLTTHPECMLADATFLDNYYSSDTNEYFFDRDPDMFKATLNYLRTGELHLPSYICGPAAKTELQFWGISTKNIERCCWMNYNEWNSTQESLKKFERAQKLHMPQQAFDKNADDSPFWTKWRPVVWRILTRSNSSRVAKVFEIISLLFVVLSIFSFLAETTELFEYVEEESAYTNSNDLLGIVTSVPTSTGRLDGSDGTSTRDGAASSTEPHDGQKNSKHPMLFAIDITCLVCFTVEYIVRFVFAPNKLKHAKTFLAIIDLLAIIADIADLIIDFTMDSEPDGSAVSYVTMVKVIRILRIFRLVRHSSGLWILLFTLKASFGELMLLVWFMALGILIFSSLIYFVEEKGKFKSIPDGFWWALITMTTVGYGDIYPETTGGKIVGSLCAMCGVLVIGFTVPALVSNFILYYRHMQFATQMEELDKNTNKSGSASDNGEIETKM